MFLSKGHRDLRFAFQTHPGSQASCRREAKDSALLSSRDGHLLEPTLWPKGSQASCEVWREDLGLLSRPCRKRWPSSRDDGGILWVFSSCGASVGFHTRYDGELREPLVWRQGSQVSMCVARGSALLLSSYGRGIWPQDTLKKDSRGLSSVVAGNPYFPRLLPVASRSFSECLWEVRDTVEMGVASRDSTAFGAMEDCREPARDIPLVTNVMRKESRHTQRRDRASGSSPVYSSASTPKNQSLPSLLLCSLTSDITGDVPYHHLTLSVKELTYSSN